MHKSFGNVTSCKETMVLQIIDTHMENLKK